MEHGSRLVSYRDPQFIQATPADSLASKLPNKALNEVGPVEKPTMFQVPATTWNYFKLDFPGWFFHLLQVGVAWKGHGVDQWWQVNGEELFKFAKCSP